MRVSEYALGRRPARDIFYRKGCVTLSVVDCLKGTPRQWRMYVECPSGVRPKPSVLYRIHVRRKPQPTERTIQ